MTLESPINPFKKKANGRERVYTSLDCVNIEKQLGFTYSQSQGSLEARPERVALPQGNSTKVIRVSGINQVPVRGSFLVSAYANIGGKKYHVGTEAVLSRWSVQYCAHCQTHLEVKAFFGLYGFRGKSLTNAEYEIEVRTRAGVLAQPRLVTTCEKKPFRFEVW